jgi:hypothetical protein
MQTILTEFHNEGKPRFNKIIVLGRRLIDTNSQTPEDEQEITITITKFTKRMIEVERTVELHRIRFVIYPWDHLSIYTWTGLYSLVG